MGAYLQVVGGVLTAVFLGLALQKQNKDMAVVLSVGVCAMVLAVMLSYLSPVLEFAETLRRLGGLDSEMMSTVLKAVGIGLIAEIAETVCADSGNAAMGKAVQMLSTGIILYLSIPVMKRLLELITEVLGGMG